MRSGCIFGFTLSFRDVEDLLAERGIVVSYETVRRWVDEIWTEIARSVASARAEAAHDTWHLDEGAPRRLLQ